MNIMELIEFISAPVQVREYLKKRGLLGRTYMLHLLSHGSIVWFKEINIHVIIVEGSGVDGKRY